MDKKDLALNDIQWSICKKKVGGSKPNQSRCLVHFRTISLRKVISSFILLDMS